MKGTKENRKSLLFAHCTIYLMSLFILFPLPISHRLLGQHVDTIYIVKILLLGLSPSQVPIRYQERRIEENWPVTIIEVFLLTTFFFLFLASTTNNCQAKISLFYFIFCFQLYYQSRVVFVVTLNEKEEDLLGFQDLEGVESSQRTGHLYKLDAATC